MITYDLIFEELQNHVDSGELTIEQAENINELAYNYYIEKKTREQYAKEKFQKNHPDIDIVKSVPEEDGSENITGWKDEDGTHFSYNKNFFKLKNNKRREAVLQHEIGHIKNGENDLTPEGLSKKLNPQLKNIMKNDKVKKLSKSYKDETYPILSASQEVMADRNAGDYKQLKRAIRQDAKSEIKKNKDTEQRQKRILLDKSKLSDESIKKYEDRLDAYDAYKKDYETYKDKLEDLKYSTDKNKSRDELEKPKRQFRHFNPQNYEDKLAFDQSRKRGYKDKDIKRRITQNRAEANKNIKKEIDQRNAAYNSVYLKKK